MMRKILSIATAFAVTLSLSSCAMWNNGRNDLNRVRYNAGSDITRMSQRNNTSNNAVYRDGVYTAYGDSKGNTNQMAIVSIRNGRIANIDLRNAARQGMAPGTTGNNTNNATGTGTERNDITQNGPSIGISGNNPSNGNNERTWGTANVPMGSNLDGARNNLARAMLREQTYNVNISSTDAAASGAINNWKVAVRRALDQARMWR